MPPKPKGSRPQKSIQPAAKDSVVYNVKEILQRRFVDGGKKEYLVWWENCKREDATWEPCDNFPSGEGNPAIKEFETKKRSEVSAEVERQRARGRDELHKTCMRNHEAQRAILQKMTEENGGSISSSSDGSDHDKGGSGDESSKSDLGSSSEDGTVNKPKKKVAKTSEGDPKTNPTCGDGTLLGWTPKFSGQPQKVLVICLLRQGICL